MTSSQKKTSFSELSSLLQSSNHTQLRHSRQSSLKTPKNLYTVPEIGLEGSSPVEEAQSRKTNGLPVSSSQLLNNIRSKKRFHSQCTISSDKRQSLKVVVNKNEQSDSNNKSFSNPINRYEYQRTYTTTPRSHSSNSIQTLKADYRKESTNLSTCSKDSPVSIKINLNLNPDNLNSRTINEEYTFDTKFDSVNGATDDDDAEKAPSITSSNQSPFTRNEIDPEPVVPIIRKDSASLEQFYSDLNNNTDSFTTLSRTQLKLNHLRNKPSESKSSFTGPEDIISLLNVSSNSSLSSNSLTPQRDTWKVTAQGKFWVNNDLSSKLMLEQLGIQCKMLKRINYNNKNVLIERVRNLVAQKKLKLDNRSDNLRGRKFTYREKKDAVTLENFVSFNILDTNDEFQEVENSELRSVLRDGKKACDELWLNMEKNEFVIYEPISKRESVSSHVSNISRSEEYPFAKFETERGSA